MEPLFLACRIQTLVVCFVVVGDWLRTSATDVLEGFH